MFADEKDIIILRNIFYKDQKKRDLSLRGHPVLIIKKTETDFYYLTISSSSSKTSHKLKGQHYKIRRNLENNLKSPVSFINLKNIYKSEIKGYCSYGTIDEEEYDEIIRRFDNFQNNVQKDEFYDEVKNISIKEK